MEDWLDLNPDPAHVRREREKARELRKTDWWRAQIAKGVCHYCHRQVGAENLTLDHVIPVSRGGRSTRGNCVPCCKECNNEKKSYTPAEQILDKLFPTAVALLAAVLSVVAVPCASAAPSLLDPVEVVPVHADLSDAEEVPFEPRQPKEPGTVEFSACIAVQLRAGTRHGMRVDGAPVSFALVLNGVEMRHSPSDASCVDLTPQLRVGMNDVVLVFRSYPEGSPPPKGLFFESEPDFRPATVDAILGVDRFEFSYKPSCVVTGVVVYAHPRISDSAILAEVARPNGRGMYVTGAFPERPKCDRVGYEMLEAGDVIEVRGFVDPMLTHAGVVAWRIERTGRVELPPPPLTTLADLKKGIRSNTRARFEGTVGGARMVNLFGRDQPELALETSGGTLFVHGIPEEECERLRGRRVFVDGVVMPYISTSGVELLPVLETTGADAVSAVPASRRMLAYASAAGKAVMLSLPLPLLAVIVFLVIDRRQRKVRARVIAAERRRIAAHLHDSVSQYLSGTRILLDTVRMSESTLPPEQREALATASQMLDVSRLEVRNAIDNLRNDDILTMRLDELLALHARRIRSARLAEVETSLAEMPDLSPKVKGDVLAVVQEAVSNAVRHGRAQHLRIEAARAGARGYVVRILNDGLPFDAGRAPGSTTGHFGLDSMRERGERSGFAVSFGEDGGWNFAELRGEAGR